MKETIIVEILKGDHAGRRAYLTWADGKYVRVTPIHDDPLLSLEFLASDVKTITGSENGNA